MVSPSFVSMVDTHFHPGALDAGLGRGRRPSHRLRGFALDFGEGEKVFPLKSAPDLWISRENPL
jgi:hypothetical protein